MKIIFLDIDGVLNNNKKPYQLERSSVKRLSYIVKYSNAKIVLSSNWRHVYLQYKNKEDMYSVNKKAIEQLLKLFSQYSLEIFDVTSVIGYGKESRPAEIQNWINLHSIESFVILDDEEVWEWDRLSNHLILCQPNGLQFKHVLKAIYILRKKKRK